MPLPICSLTLIVCTWSIILYYAGFSLVDDSDLVFRDLSRLGRADGLNNVTMTAALASLL